MHHHGAYTDAELDAMEKSMTPSQLVKFGLEQLEDLVEMCKERGLDPNVEWEHIRECSQRLKEKPDIFGQLVSIIEQEFDDKWKD